MDVLSYITRESGSLAVGRHFVGLLRQKCANLASIRGQFGTARPELTFDIRAFPFRNSVIFFRYVDDGATLEVVNVLEGHRDVERPFKNDTATRTRRT